MAAMICAWAFIFNSGSSLTAYKMMHTTLHPIVLSCCANIFISFSNMLLQFQPSPSQTRKKFIVLPYSLCASEWPHCLLEVAGRSGVWVLFFSGFVGTARVTAASFLPEVGRIVPDCFSMGASGIIVASFSGELVHVDWPISLWELTRSY